MNCFSVLLRNDLKRRSKNSFLIGYNIIFPIIMTVLLGYLLQGGYGSEFTGYQYYSIVFLPFSIAMAIISAAYAGKDEAYHRTAPRLLFAPVSKCWIVLAKLLSCTIIISLCNVIVLLFAAMVYRLPVLLKFFPVTLLLTSETFCICAIGLFIGLGMKQFILIKNILNIPICVAGILGGVFYPIGTLNQKIDFLTKLSPLTWINRSIFLTLYDNSTGLLWKITGFFILAGGFFTIIAIKFFKKEEFIHGNLPGYNQ